MPSIAGTVRRGPARDHHGALGAERVAVHLYRVGGNQAGAAPHEASAAAFETTHGFDVVPVGGDVADPARHPFPIRVNLDATGGHARAARLGEQVRAAHHDLRGDAAVVRTLAADEVLVDAEHAESRVEERRREGLTPDAHAEHDHVDGLIRHARPPRHERSPVVGFPAEPFRVVARE